MDIVINYKILFIEQEEGIKCAVVLLEMYLECT